VDGAVTVGAEADAVLELSAAEAGAAAVLPEEIA
jgi:hypothetical protein